MTKIIDNLNWRYATKDFDTEKKISEEDLNEVIETFRLTPSSFGLEPWKLVVVENSEIRSKLLEHSWNQKQVIEASHLLVFTRIKNMGDEHIDEFLDNSSKVSGATREQLKGYEDMMKGYFSGMDDSAKKLWAEQQVYLALGNVMNTLAQKHIDSCAIGGFNPVKYDEILGLEDKGLASVVVLPIGYRSDDDKYANKPKVRFDKEKILEII